MLSLKLKGEKKMRIYKGDITTLNAGVNCIVNAANEICLFGGGIDEAISNAGGAQLYDRRWNLQKQYGSNRCKTGDAVMTVVNKALTKENSKFGVLEQTHVIQAVGPRFSAASAASVAEGDIELLKGTYENSMNLVNKNNKNKKNSTIKIICFCIISGGIFADDGNVEIIKKNIQVGLNTIIDVSQKKWPIGLEEVHFVEFDGNTYSLLENAFKSLGIIEINNKNPYLKTPTKLKSEIELRKKVKKEYDNFKHYREHGGVVKYGVDIEDLLESMGLKNKSKKKDLYNLKRFIDGQKEWQAKALQEIKNGKKETCWIWYCLPTPPYIGESGKEKGSGKNKENALRDHPEGKSGSKSGSKAAKAYLEIKSLRKNYLDLVTAIVFQLETTEANVEKLMGHLDVPKLKSSLELFEKASKRGSDIKNICQRALTFFPKGKGISNIKKGILNDILNDTPKDTTSSTSSTTSSTSSTTAQASNDTASSTSSTSAPTSKGTGSSTSKGTISTPTSASTSNVLLTEATITLGAPTGGHTFFQKGMKNQRKSKRKSKMRSKRKSKKNKNVNKIYMKKKSKKKYVNKKRKKSKRMKGGKKRRTLKKSKPKSRLRAMILKRIRSRTLKRN